MPAGADAAAGERRTAQRRALFAGSLALSMALCVWLVARDARAFGAALGILGLALAAGLAAARSLGGWLVVLALLNALVVLPELALRAAGFRCVSGVQFGYPTPEEFWEFVPDEELFWRLPPGDDPPVNSLGFFGPEPEIPKPAGSARLVVLGDSCTQQGFPQSVPDHLARILSGSGVPVELVNLSMSGYSSHQGRALAERTVPPLAPDLALVWYGWNDHWQAYGATDREKRGSLMPHNAMPQKLPVTVATQLEVCAARCTQALMTRKVFARRSQGSRFGRLEGLLDCSSDADHSGRPWRTGQRNHRQKDL